jgi:PAS domain S-box-containing protein
MADLTEELILEEPDSFWQSHREKFAWLILILNMLITFYFWKTINNAAYKDAETRFAFRTEQIRADIEDRIRIYEQVLRSGIGLFKSSGNVARSEWKNFTKALQIEKEFPGIQGIGFSLKITPEDKEEHIRQIQAEGFPDYKIKPEGEREEYTSIIYLEPFDVRNQQAFGYDMFSQVVRREAMEKARDTGETAISGRVTLVQEIDENTQSGFLIYLPLYKKGMPVDTLNQRRMALHGYVYSPFRVTNLMRGILGPGSKDIDFEIYDGVEIKKSELMYDSDESGPGERNGQGSSKNIHHMFSDTKVLDIHDHLWSLGFKTLPSFEASIDSNKSTFVLLLGGLFSLLCFVVIQGAFTTRKQALQYASNLLQKMKTNEERLSYALEGTNDGIWDWNIITGEVYFSPRAMTMLGYEPLELEGNIKTWEDLTHPDDKQWVMNALNKHLENKAPIYETEHRLKTKSGEYAWILDRGKVFSRDEDGKPLRMTGCHTDINARKIAEEELHRYQNHLSELVIKKTREIKGGEQKFKSYFDLPLVGIAITSPEKEWLDSNQYLCEMLGYSLEELKQLTWEDLTHPDDLQADVSKFNQILAGEIDTYFLEKRFIRKDGTTLYVLLSVACVRSENAKVETLFAVLQDISERKRAEEQLEQSHLQLVHADKLSSLGKLVGSVAHEFNNPLFGITNLVDLLGDDRPLEERKKYSEVAMKECKRMATLIRNLQSFYKPSQGIATPVDLNKLIDEVLTVIGKSVKQKGAKVSRVNADSKVIVNVVEDQIKQVVMNLIQNASDSFTGNPGEIILTAEQDETNTTIKVQDTGSGITEENIPNLFDPFFTTKGVKGTGLGLSLSYGIVQNHGGKIEVDSELDKGSTFTLVLPTQGVLK